MSSKKSNWLFSLLWINVAVVIVVFVRFMGNQTMSGRTSSTNSGIHFCSQT
jgi:hypothetical protein